MGVFNEALYEGPLESQALDVLVGVYPAEWRRQQKSDSRTARPHKEESPESGRLGATRSSGGEMPGRLQSFRNRGGGVAHNQSPPPTSQVVRTTWRRGRLVRNGMRTWSLFKSRLRKPRNCWSLTQRVQI